MVNKSNRDLLMEAPDDWWQREAVCLQLRDWFEHHIVGLHVGYLCDDTPQDRVFTGFLLKHRGLAFWITAAHVIERINQLIDDPRLTIDHAGWMDRCPSPGAGPIPASLPDLLMGVLERDGIDLGFVVLNPLLEAAFDANPRVEFVDARIWLGHDAARPEGYYVLGYPKEWTLPMGKFKSANGEMRRKIRMGVACLPVTPIEDRGAAANPPLESPFWGSEFCMYAQLQPYSDTKRHLVENIDGMSGGPVLSIERSADGQLKYRLFGIQSAWQRGARIVKATRVGVLDALVEHIRHRVEQAEAEAQRSDEQSCRDHHANQLRQ